MGKGRLNMFIVDTEIKKLCEQEILISDNYNPDNVGSVSYDLTIEYIRVYDEKKKEYINETSFELYPNKTIFICTSETLTIPDNMIGIINEKTSVMREGLLVNAPNYQPGICSKCFIRVTNISEHIITIKQGKKIAQILFDTLSQTPECPYNNQPDASYNNEFEYLGYGKYKTEYSKEIKKINRIKDDLDSKVQSIYSNVLVFMGIIATIFTIITINFEAFKDKILTPMGVLSLNLSMAFITSFLVGILSLFISKKKKVVFLYNLFHFSCFIIYRKFNSSQLWVTIKGRG